MSLTLGSCKMHRPSHLPYRVLKVYIEDLTRFSHVDCSDDPNNTLLPQGCVLLGQLLAWGMQVECKVQGQGVGWRLPCAWVQLRGQSSCLLITSFSALRITLVFHTLKSH